MDSGNVFRQELKLKEGYVDIYGFKNGLNVTVRIWADVFNPVVHVDIVGNRNTSVTIVYENWRQTDRELTNS